MSDKYGDAREELGRMIERKEILEGLLSHIDACMNLRNGLESNSVERVTYTTVIDALLFVAKTIQARGVG